MRAIVGALCFALLWIGSAQAQTASAQPLAASVIPLKGDLSLNQGQGFQPVDGSVTANVGDSFMVGPDGAATVIYQDGCQVTVQPGTVTTIAPLSPCASGSLAKDQSQFDFGQGAGLAGLIGLTVLLGTELHHHIHQHHPVSP